MILLSKGIAPRSQFPATIGGLIALDPCILGDPQTKGDKTRIGCLNPAFSGARRRAEMLHNPFILWDPQQRGQKSKHKKAKTNQKTNFPLGAPPRLEPQILPELGFDPMTSQLQRHWFTH